MLALCLCALSLTQTPDITRSSYGVPLVRADSIRSAFRSLGYATAQDRLWQLETSRRAATGTMAEVLGAQYVASDKETLLTGYTDAETKAQYERLAPDVKQAFEGYVDGINAYLQSNPTLPAGYAQNGFAPKPWTIEDSMAITVRLFRRFGSGGAGELRNMALLGYFGTQPKLKGRELDLLDDFLWFNDPEAIPTLKPEDEVIKAKRAAFINVTPQQTAAHLAMLPKIGLLELLPAVRLAGEETSRRVAQSVAAPFKTGSYAVVVGPKRSKTGHPILLSAPQMGFTQPTVVYEAGVISPQLKVTGMMIPGVPTFAIGRTPYMANALTTGAADTEDIVFYKKVPGGYQYGTEVRPFNRYEVELKVKGAKSQMVTVTRTHDGPLVLDSREYVFARRSVFWGKETDSLNAVFEVFQAKKASDIDRASEHTTVNFNFFYAFSNGDFGWHYLGRMPIRAYGYDPRLPLPGGPKTEWTSIVSGMGMPNIRNPKSGLLANWNNKPTPWWPNLDTPTWQRLFRNRALLDNLAKPMLGTDDVEYAAWDIARRENNAGYNYSAPHFMPLFTSALAGEQSMEASWLRSYDGRALDGTIPPTIYNETFKALREELFSASVGNFINPEFFQTAIQPAVILAALEGRTKFDYLAGRNPKSLVRAALLKATDRLRKKDPNIETWAYRASGIPSPDGILVPYRDRGTYIQIIELGPVVRGRNVMPPGNAETGPHSADQLPLSRSWTYKPMLKLED